MTTTQNLVGYCRIDVPLSMVTDDWLDNTQRTLKDRGLTEFCGRVRGNAYTIIAVRGKEQDNG